MRSPRTLAHVGLLLVVGACGEEAPSCAPMCAAATSLYGECLDEWGLDWEAAGHAGPGAFRAACDTWAWEMGELEKDAVQRDVLEQRGALERSCRQRHRAFTDADATCATYTDVDWSLAPWETPAPPP